MRPDSVKKRIHGRAPETKDGWMGGIQGRA